MTSDEIKRLKELTERATPGPWKSDFAIPTNGAAEVWGPRYVKSNVKYRALSIEDAEFIAAARKAVPKLIEIVEEFKQKGEELCQALGTKMIELHDTKKKLDEATRLLIAVIENGTESALFEKIQAVLKKWGVGGIE